MTHFKSPQGELIEVNGGGAHALAALGWVKVSSPDSKKQDSDSSPEATEKQPARRGRRKTTDE